MAGSRGFASHGGSILSRGWLAGHSGLHFSCSFVLARNKNNLKFYQSLQLLVKFICISPMHSTSHMVTWVGKIHRQETGHVVMTQSTRF